MLHFQREHLSVPPASSILFTLVLCSREESKQRQSAENVNKSAFCQGSTLEISHIVLFSATSPFQTLGCVHSISTLRKRDDCERGYCAFGILHPKAVSFTMTCARGRHLQLIPRLELSFQPEMKFLCVDHFLNLVAKWSTSAKNKEESWTVILAKRSFVWLKISSSYDWTITEFPEKSLLAAKSLCLRETNVQP